ncbi:hypothetical protein E4K67_28090 [Desulfosporosinus fructosivorans]|uniref:Uncharacterized protein n=1 Tax=Desulfosporosinus fructosivorans TaxID=2018669 RepID=A0A4Z0QZZ7_9FIRM|nr:hypothetical protein [Desulfosporosinus fructosivorans]TGE34946.1 hypothetical protein E4K67_28090 [Desulfosporosinus fructosivorans]
MEKGFLPYEDYELLKKNAIKNLTKIGVSPLYITEWEDVYNDPKATRDEFEGIELRILNGLLSYKNEYFLEVNRNNLYYSLQKEIYKVVCTDSKEYSDQRNAVKSYLEKGTIAIATILASKFGIETAMLTGLISLVMVGISKVGKNAWCNCYSVEFEEDNNGDQEK